MTDAPAEDTPAPLWLPMLQIWLKSESLDVRNELRFEPGPSDYDSSNWQLRKFESWRGFRPPFDDSFDWNFRNALVLPRAFSHMRIEPCYRRSMANFVVRHVGHWNGDGERYGAVLSALSRPLRTVAGRPVRQVFALTPFSIIAQQFRDGAGPEDGGEIAHTEILFFYTFENFIQEALAQNAYTGGTATDTIVSAYEHVYTNTQPSTVLLRDPAGLRLAAHTTDFSWTGIRNHMLPRSLERSGGTAEDWPLNLRELLFQCRLQAHLMVAIAAACHGIASFQHAAYASPLVAPLRSVPTIGDLAPSWLRHLFGAYDQADACMRLLESLARYHGEDVRLDPMGSIISEDRGAKRTGAAESIGSVIPPFGHDDMAEGWDTFRFGIFDTAIDDGAVAAWYQDVCNRFVQRRG